KSGRWFEWVDRNSLVNSGYFYCLTIVNRCNLPSNDRRMFDGGVHHAIHPNVLTIDSPSCAQLRQVVAGHSFADVAPLIWSSELDSRCWNRQLRGRRSELSITEAATRLRMYDHVQIRLALGRRHFPFLGRCQNEHEPRGGTSLPHDVEKTTDGMRAIGVLITIAAVADGLIDF